MNPSTPSKKNLDYIFPTVVRYAGVFILVALTADTIIRGKGVEYPGLIVAATGMILYKTVRGENGNGKSTEQGNKE